MAFGPKSHVVDPFSEGRLKSWWNSAVQSTGSTTNCPAIGGWSLGQVIHQKLTSCTLMATVTVSLPSQQLVATAPAKMKGTLSMVHTSGLKRQRVAHYC